MSERLSFPCDDIILLLIASRHDSDCHQIASHVKACLSKKTSTSLLPRSLARARVALRATAAQQAWSHELCSATHTASPHRSLIILRLELDVPRLKRDRRYVPFCDAAVHPAPHQPPQSRLRAGAHVNTPIAYHTMPPAADSIRCA